jgi:hypothetical protein
MLGIISVGVAVVALIASAIFFALSAQQLRSSTQRLQRTMNVLGQYLKATIQNADVDLNWDAAGDLIGLDIRLHVASCVIGVHAEGDLTLIPGKKPD